MDEMDAPIKQGRTGLIVLILVIVGVGLLGVGVYLVINKRKGEDAEAKGAAGNTEGWCKLRQEWKRKVTPLDGDIMVKNAEDAESTEAKALRTQRNTLCHEFAGKVRDILKDPAVYTAVQAVEAALVKEGKTRSNLAVKIANKVNAEIPKAGTTDELDKIRKALEVEIVALVKKKRGEYDKEIASGLSSVQPACIGIYHGTMTDQGTSGNPYTSWDELEIERTKALRLVKDKIRELAPAEQFYNRVRHDLMARHKKDLLTCYNRTKKNNPKIPSLMGLKIKLTKKGKVRGLNFAAWDQKMDAKILDCLSDKAGKWKLPKASDEFQEADITIDFSKM